MESDDITIIESIEVMLKMVTDLIERMDALEKSEKETLESLLGLVNKLTEDMSDLQNSIESLGNDIDFINSPD